MQNEIATATAAVAVPAPVDLFDRWVSFLDVAPRTVETYTKGVRAFFRWMASEGIDRPARADVVAFRDSMAIGHKPTTVQGYLAAVKVFFRWAADEKLYENVAERVKAPKVDKAHKKDYLIEAQVKKVLGGIDRSTVGGLRDYAIVALMVTTGLRTISVVRADIGDMRPAGGDMALYYQGKGRTEKAKYVKITPPVEEAIRAYLSARGRADETAPLFASVAYKNDGGRMTTRSVSRLVKGSLVGAGLDSPRLSAHSLRHSAACLNILHGGTLAETQDLLDHSSSSTTMIYSHALERAKNNSESRISAAIFG